LSLLSFHLLTLLHLLGQFSRRAKAARRMLRQARRHPNQSVFETVRGSTNCRLRSLRSWRLKKFFAGRGDHRQLALGLRIDFEGARGQGRFEHRVSRDDQPIDEPPRKALLCEFGLLLCRTEW